LQAFKAVAQAHAGEAAFLAVAAAEEHGGLAVLRAAVIEASGSHAGFAGAGDERDHLHRGGGFDAHHCRDLGRGGGAAGHALIGGSFSGSHGGGIAVASGEAAAAAVCAGQAFADSRDLGVNVNMEYLCRKAQDRGRKRRP
jgi:hypothetical protein